jgi:hypothetical protein
VPHLLFSPLVDLAFERMVWDQVCAAECVIKKRSKEGEYKMQGKGTNAPGEHGACGRAGPFGSEPLQNAPATENDERRIVLLNVTLASSRT